MSIISPLPKCGLLSCSARTKSFGNRPRLNLKHVMSSKLQTSLEKRSSRFVVSSQRESLEAPELVETTSEEGPSTSGRQEDPQPSGGRDIPYWLIAAAAAAGAGITGYLAVVGYSAGTSSQFHHVYCTLQEKITGGEVACPASGSCETILSSGYATVLGIPLSLIGFLAYGAVAGLAGWQTLKQQGERGKWEKLGVLGGGTVLASTSASLLYLLATQFPGQSCTWCLSSAFLSFSIFFAACYGFRLRELGELAVPGSATAVSTILFLALAWSGVEAPQALADINIPYQATIVRRESTPQAVELAKRLKEAGAKMYGAFWCSHCQEQKVSFGAQAQKDLPYIECFPEGYRTGVQMAQECKDANLEGFPMWVINGKKYSGEQRFNQLEAALDKKQ